MEDLSLGKGFLSAGDIGNIILIMPPEPGYQS